MIRVILHRSKTVSDKLQSAAREVSYRVSRGMRAMGDALLEMSRELCPKDTNTLVDDSRVRQEYSAMDTVVVVGYGTGEKAAYLFSEHEGKMVRRDPAQYAVYVHEDPQKVHPNGEYGFLEKVTDGSRDTELKAALAQGMQT